MRAVNSDGPLSVQAISGTYVVLLGINMAETEKSGVLGFGIQRTDLTNNQEPVWLQGFKSFKSAHLPRGTITPTNKHPIQAFLWGDYTARKDHQYTYRIVAMRGQPGDLKESHYVPISRPQFIDMYGLDYNHVNASSIKTTMITHTGSNSTHFMVQSHLSADLTPNS